MQSTSNNHHSSDFNTHNQSQLSKRLSQSNTTLDIENTDTQLKKAESYSNLQLYKIHNTIDFITEGYESILSSRMEIILNNFAECDALNRGIELLTNCEKMSSSEYENYMNSDSNLPISKTLTGKELIYLNGMLRNPNLYNLSKSEVYKNLLDGRHCKPPSTKDDKTSARLQIQCELRKTFREIFPTIITRVKEKHNYPLGQSR
jgi:hypothetical protein